MIRSLRTGVSGLKSNQVRMDVIGNNVANVNTTGFKRSRAAFNEVLGQQLLGVGRTAGGTGINPSFVGLGVAVGSIDQNWSQGALENTGVSTDLALNGDGFFVARVGDRQLLTRSGNFTFNRNGELVTGNGLNVQGWAFNADGELHTGALEDIKINLNAQAPARQTENIYISNNLSATTQLGQPTTISTVIYDAQGKGHTVLVEFQKIQKTGQYGAAEDVWQYTVKDQDGNPLQTGNALSGAATVGSAIYAKWSDGNTEPTVGGTYGGAANHRYEFKVTGTTDTDADGVDDAYVVAWNNEDGTTDTANIDMAAGGTITTAEGVTVDFTGATSLTLGDSFYVDGMVDEEVRGTLTFGSDGALSPSNLNAAGEEIFTFNWDLDGNGAPDEFTLNFGDPTGNGLTQFNGSTTAGVSEQDGNPDGTLIGYSINTEGILQLNFSNGMQERLFQLAIGRVNNPNGLEQQGENFYTPSAASGEVQYGRAGRDLRTAVVAGTLEMSNVDLATEFTEMIVAQRGYQAAARVITTSDELLQETVSLKR